MGNRYVRMATRMREAEDRYIAKVAEMVKEQLDKFSYELAEILEEEGYNSRVGIEGNASEDDLR